MVRLRVLAVPVLLVACGAVLKPPEPSRLLDVSMRGEMFESDRGYRFAVLPEPGWSDIVRLDVRYPVGSIDDPPGKEGLAHLVEHLLFQAEFTRGDTKTSISAELGRIAISWNATTYPDHTTYQILAAATELDQLIKLEVDRVAIGCAGLTPEIVAREREVVLNELRQSQGASGASLQRQIYEAVYAPGHPYLRVDSVETVAKLELADVCAFLAGPYLRGTAIVVASGGVDRDAVKASAAKHLARLRKRSPASRTSPPVATPRPGTIRIKADVDEPMLMITWPLPPRMTPGARILDMLWPAIPSRIEQFAFVYDWGHSSSATIIGGQYAPVLALSITLSSADKLDDAIEATRKAIPYAHRTLGENSESAAWVLTWESEAEALLARWDSSSSRNLMFGDFMQFETGPSFLSARVQELASSHPGQARALADQWLTPGRARYILIEPTGAPASSSAITFRGGAAEHPVTVDGSLADSPLPMPTARQPLDVLRYQLDNGLRVVMWPHGEAPVVHGRLVVDSGTAHDPENREGTARLMGADRVEADSLVFTSRSLANRVDANIQTLAYPLRNPGFELSDEDKSFLRGRLRQRRAKERTTYDIARLTAVYGARHPYARSAMTEASLDRISRDNVVGWAREHSVGNNATLVLVGKFDPELVKKHIDYNADHVASGSDSADRDAAPIPTRSFIRGVTEKPLATVELAVHFTAGEGMDMDHAMRLVLEKVLSSRLSVLRGTHAVTYGFSASYDPRRAGGLWTIGGEADASRASEAATALMSILHEMRTSPESYRAAFVLGRQKVLEDLLVSTTSPAQIADLLAKLAAFDLAETAYQALPGQVAALTLTKFHAFMQRELDGEGQVFGAFGNAPAVTAAIAAAKLAP